MRNDTWPSPATSACPRAPAPFQEVPGTPLPLHHPPGAGRGPVVPHAPGPGALHLKDAVPGWHHPRGVRAGGFHRAMTWAQRLKRVFKLDLTSCAGCGGQVRVLACLEDPLVIGKILGHRETQQAVRVQTGRAALCLRGCAGRESPGTGALQGRVADDWSARFPGSGGFWAPPAPRVLSAGALNCLCFERRGLGYFRACCGARRVASLREFLRCRQPFGEG